VSFHRPKTIHFALAMLSVSFAASACNVLLPKTIGAVSAENPLKGQPIQWSKKADGVPFEGQRACTVWPIEDELTVTATPEQICVKGHTYQVVGAQFRNPPAGHSLGISSDGSGESGFVAGSAGSVKPQGVRKIGQCTNLNSSMSVWEEPYDGCVPNRDPNGKPALTDHSTFLEVGRARWSFPAAEPAAKASPSK
jgi:hypothetical protein